MSSILFGTLRNRNIKKNSILCGIEDIFMSLWSYNLVRNARLIDIIENYRKNKIMLGW